MVLANALGNSTFRVALGIGSVAPELNYLFPLTFFTWRVRLSVRTPDFHSGKSSSILLPATGDSPKLGLIEAQRPRAETSSLIRLPCTESTAPRDRPSPRRGPKDRGKGGGLAPQSWTRWSSRPVGAVLRGEPHNFKFIETGLNPVYPLRVCVLCQRGN